MSKRHGAMIRFGALAAASAASLASAAAAGAATTSSTVGSVPSPPSASTTTSTAPVTLADLKSTADREIKTRIQMLNAAVSRVKAGKGDRSGEAALKSYLGHDIGPLQQLDAKIQADRTETEVRSDSGTIFSDFRVYRLVLPAAHLAASANRVTGTELPSLRAMATRAQKQGTHAGKAKSGKATAGKATANQATVSPLVGDLNAQITAATNATAGLATSVLADTPAQWNANNALLAGPQSALGQAVAAVKQGRHDAKQLRALLEPRRSHHAHTHHAHTPHKPKSGTVSTTSTT